MHTRSRFIRSLITATAFLGVSAAALVASARTTPADIGIAVSPSQANCFAPTGAAIGQYFCTGTGTAVPWWEMPLVLDNAGSKSVTLTVQAPDINHNLLCWASATDGNGNNTVTTTQHSAMTFGTPTTMTLNGFSVLSGGRAWVTCEMAQNSEVITVNYNP